MRAVYALDEPGIDRGRKRRIVEGHGQILSSGFAGFLPGRANVLACRLHVEVRGAFVVALVVGNEFDVQGQGTELVSEAIFLCGEGADVSHDVFSFLVEQGRASASLL